MSAKASQDGMEMVPVLLEATTIHKDVIEIYYFILIKHIEEDLVCQPLKG